MTADVEVDAARAPRASEKPLIAHSYRFECTATDTGVRVEYHVPQSPVIYYELTHAEFTEAMRTWRTHARTPSGLVTNGRLLYCEATHTSGFGMPQAWVFEREPEWITLEYVPVSRYIATSEQYEDAGQRYRIFLPYTVWFITASGQVQLGFSATPITHPDQPLYLPLLPNVYYSSVLCLGDATMPSRVTGKERLAWAYQSFFEQRFNNDLAEAFYHACSEQRATAFIDAEFFDEYHSDSVVETSALMTDVLERWERMSESEVLAADWPTIRAPSNTQATATMQDWIDKIKHLGSHDAAHRGVHALHTQLYYARQPR